MNAPGRLLAHSEEVTLADKFQCLVTICTDEQGRPWEVVLKMKSSFGKEGSETQLLASDLGIYISRMLQGRPAVGEGKSLADLPECIK